MYALAAQIGCPVALNIQSGAAARDTFNEMVARVKRLQLSLQA